MRVCWSGQTGQTQDLLAYAYKGSNPFTRIFWKEIKRDRRTYKPEKFGSYIKGFAGISSLIFVIQFSVVVFKQQSFSDMLQILIAFIMAVVSYLPAYFLYAKLIAGKKYLHKGLTELRKLEDEHLIQQ